MSAYIENKAIQLRNIAENKINGVGFFQSLFGNKHKIEAIEYYSRAANLFKIAGNWLQAGISFCNAADLNLKFNNELEAAIIYSEAAECFQKYDYMKAIEFFLRSIKIYLKIEKFTFAVKVHQTIAHILEDHRDINGAIAHHERIIELSKNEKIHHMANNSMRKVGEFAALAGNYYKAIKMFQEIASYILASSLEKNNVIEYFLRAAICYLCLDPYLVDEITDSYCRLYSEFKDSREYELIRCLAYYTCNKDLENYADSMRTYDTISKLSMWHVTMLLKAKNKNFELNSS